MTTETQRRASTIRRGSDTELVSMEQKADCWDRLVATFQEQAHAMYQAALEQNGPFGDAMIEQIETLLANYRDTQEVV